MREGELRVVVDRDDIIITQPGSDFGLFQTTRSVIHCCKGYSGRQPGFQNASVANCHCKSAPAWVDRIRRSAPSGLATKMERTASRWRRDYSLADRGPDGRVAIA